MLEHMVDTVLYFEGDKNLAYRIIRASKNRFGSTNEIGIFEMGETGLRQVENPSAALLSGKPHGVSGTCTVCVLEGRGPSWPRFRRFWWRAGWAPRAACLQEWSKTGVPCCWP